MKQSHKTLLLWVLLILMFVAIWTMVSSHSEPPRAVAFTDFVHDIQAGKVAEVTVRTQDGTGHYRYTVRGPDGDRPEAQPRETFGILSDQVNEMLMQSDARVEYQPKEENILSGVLLTWLPMLFLL
ncbi:MAG: ATP-dependent metallopeptidase FtsH/Yme1/Tma family protein, partial [Myxococcales bacterium]|nr:ATP-dependent metallopeptidase FtsH/Yme1/Tma family protein [Myxococcales bacterium]